MKELLIHRRKIKAKKPNFAMQDSHKYKDLRRRWRKPKGLHSKMRMNKKGYPKTVRTGYGSPAAVKHMTRSGLVPVLVSRVAELEGLGKENAILIRGAVGTRRRIEIIKAAKEKGLAIANYKEPEKFVQKAMERAEKKKAKEQKKKETVEKKKPAEEKLSEEEKKKQERKEMEKTITKRA
ncbi:50S ribosomal protein L32e [Candidatus Woesearchaeota archaeon]|nr:50S ribosomal protein L32e [Candidatus Woesearchaeota archaeon]